MKIRIKGNSVRYRLTKTDVEAFTQNGYVEETVDFGSQTLVYALERNYLNNLSALFEGNRITLFMPESLAADWARTDKIGFEYQYNELFLLVEKDFACLDNVAEDQSDHYPNPLAKVC